MSEFFLQIVNMSISASWIVLAVLILRLLLKKAPKWITVLLWGVVAVRLICPFTIESVLSLIPSAQTVSPDIMLDRTPSVNTGVPVINNALNPVLVGSLAPDPTASANPLQILIPVAATLWLVGIAIMLIYTAISYLRVIKRIGTAVLLRDNIYQSENVVSPFVLGIIKPKIYLPFSISEQDTEHVIAHEQAHLKRCDHLWKPLGFLILSLHWFNPLMWVGYVLLCRDIELACDEKVIKELTPEQRADYSQALLTCSVSRRMIAACPLAFGEIGVKNRVKTVLNYKKPAFWIIIVAIIAIVVVAVCFLTDPTSDKPNNIEDQTHDSTSETDIGDVDTPQNTITSAQIDRLKAKFPEYFNLTTSKGLEVYVWQMAHNLFNCGVMPGVNRVYQNNELWKLSQNPTNLYEMRIIIAYYLSIGAVTREEVSIIAITMPYSSYAYTIDEKYRKTVADLFWEDFPIIESPKYTGYIAAATFDIDDDGKDENCTLGYGPTSGLFSFTITASENGEPEYFNIFTTSYMELGFEKLDSGETVLVGKNGEDVKYLHLGVENGNIVLDGDEQTSYWGEQGLDSPHISRIKTIRSFDLVGTSMCGFSLYDNGTFSFHFSPVSSYIGVGNYTWEDEQRLTLRTYDEKYVIRFTYEGGEMIYNATDEGVWKPPFEDGDVFTPQYYTEVEMKS